MVVAIANAFGPIAGRIWARLEESPGQTRRELAVMSTVVAWGVFTLAQGINDEREWDEPQELDDSGGGRIVRWGGSGMDRV